MSVVPILFLFFYDIPFDSLHQQLDRLIQLIELFEVHVRLQFDDHLLQAKEFYQE